MKMILVRLLPVLLTPGFLGPTTPVQAQNSRSEPIVYQQFRVPPAGYVYYLFEVDPTRMREAVVIGQFQAAGGTGNDIEVVVAEREQFLNWANGHGGNIIYSSGKKTAGRVSVRVEEPGEYVVAFNNRFSPLSPKNVAANLNLEYFPR
jgi:hypothetical protein